MSNLPTKKQKGLLDFITAFMGEYGYSPSYREIKAGMSYGSIATVAKHVDNLVAKGLIKKRDHAARSLEPLSPIGEMPAQLRPKTSNNEKWLVDNVDARFRMIEAKNQIGQKDLDQLTVLVATLRVLDLDGAFSAFSARLRELEKK